jgi:large subunit ribosomal protein L7/L12
MATDTAKVLETLGKMTVLELVELKNAIEEEWGVTAAAPVAAAAPAAAAAAATARRPRRSPRSTWSSPRQATRRSR